MDLTADVKNFLRGRGADLVGIGNLREVEACQFETGIAVAVALPKHVIADLREAPTEEYYHVYHALNKRLNGIVSAGEDFLKQRGFAAYAQTTERVKLAPNKISPLPHKTVATRAGLGWIGKNCLLVTPQYGSAIRISSLLTDAPLQCDEPINQSRCGACGLCVRGCPGQALKGRLWAAGTERAAIMDIEACYKTQVEIMSKHTGIETDLCGKCFAVCAYTGSYLGDALCANSPGRIESDGSL